MEVVTVKDGKYLLRFDRGEEVISGLKKFAEEKKIPAAYFSGIGAVEEVILSWYNIEEKRYHDHLLTKKLEISSLLGNITWLGEEIVVHAHGSFSDVELHNRSGHVKKMIVSATCEIVLEAFDKKVEREHDEMTGLSLLKK